MGNDVEAKLPELASRYCIHSKLYFMSLNRANSITLALQEGHLRQKPMVKENITIKRRQTGKFMLLIFP